jgi:acyl carrier protein
VPHAESGSGSVFVELVHEQPDPRWRLHPGLLEACLHILELAVPPARNRLSGEGLGVRGSAPRGDADGRTVAEIAGLRVGKGARLGTRVHVNAVLTDTNDDALTGDVLILNEDGAEVAAVRGVRLTTTPLLPMPADLPELVYDLAWRERPRGTSDQEEDAGTGPWLVLADRGGVGDALAERLRARGDGVRVLPPVDDPDRLAREVRELVTGPGCRGAVHLWALDLPEEPRPDGLESVYASVSRLAAALGATAKATAPRAWYVTRGAQETGPEPRPPAAGQAPVWSLATVAGLDHPASWGGLLDLDPADDDTTRAAETILAELTGSDGEDRLAHRGDTRYSCRLVHRPVPESVVEPPHLSPDGTYLVAAPAPESAEVARTMAAWLDERGAGRVLQCGPSGEDVDLTDQAAVSDLVARLDDEGRPLRGVVWAAPKWSLSDGPSAGPEEIAADLRDRALGAVHLDAASDGLDLFVVFAGAASSWGSRGAGRQAPADALLAALAARRTAGGRPALCVHWAPWDDPVALDQQTRVQMTRSGMAPLDLRSAVTALDHLVGTGAAEAAVAHVDWSLMLPLYRQAMRWPLFDEIAAEREKAADGAPSALAGRLAALPASEREDHLVETVLAEVAVVLGMAAGDELEPAEGFFELGMTSVTALELKVRLERLLGSELPATLAFECPTAADLARFLRGELDGELDEAAPSTETAPEPGPDETDDLTARFDAEMAAAQKATR